MSYGAHDKSVHNVNNSLKMLRQVSCHTAYERNKRSQVVGQGTADIASACVVRKTSL